LANAAASGLGFGYTGAEVVGFKFVDSCAAIGGNAYLSIVPVVVSADTGVVAAAYCGSIAGVVFATGIA
jgi:hypothetical protein